MKTNNYTRRGEFSEGFLNGLKCYNDIIQYCNDPQNELDIKVRGGYLNIYYKGGNLMKLSKSDNVEFNEFYFYLPQKDDFTSTDIQKLISNKAISKIRKNSRKLRNMTDEEICQAQEIARKTHKKLEDCRNNAIKELKDSSTYEETVVAIERIKYQMDKWMNNKKEPKNERTVQHYISLSNKKFDDHCDFVVLDIEYALPYDSVYFNKKNKRTKHPRLDIIAIDKEGQIYVMELKYGMKSVDINISGAKEHLKDFNDTVGHPDKWRAFLEDVGVLFGYLQKKGMIAEEMIIDIHKKPIFAFVMKMQKESDKLDFINYLAKEKLSETKTLYLPCDNNNQECNCRNNKLHDEHKNT